VNNQPPDLECFESLQGFGQSVIHAGMDGMEFDMKLLVDFFSANVVHSLCADALLLGSPHFFLTGFISGAPVCVSSLSARLA
jgi:hypothetical protein